MGARTRGLRRVRVRRDPGVSRGTHLLIGGFSPMGDDDSALWGGELGCSETGYSPKCPERPSEKSRTRLQRSLTGRQRGAS